MARYRRRPAMRHDDPQLPLNCPACGARLRYGASTDSGTLSEPTEITKPGADTHHYVCTVPGCGRFWKFGPGTGLVTDKLQLAAAARTAH